MTPEEEIVALLGRAFPSLAGLDPAEGKKRADSLGRYAAGLWPAKGVPVAPAVHAQLAPAAAQAGKAPGAGAAFLVALRGALGDAQFAPVLTSIGTQFARAAAARPSLSSSGVTAALSSSGEHAAPARSSGLSSSGTAAALSSSSANAALPSAPPKAGPTTLREVGGFELVKLLGEGGMGKVFKARQKSLDRVVALKVLAPQLAQDAEYVERFKREAIAAAALHHPNIVGVIEHGTDPANGMHFIAFEFVDGMTVEAMLKARTKLPEREALATARAVASALECAEAAGIVHRDIKPDNIIVGKDGVPRVVDLGLAKKQGDKSQMTVVGVVMGTPQYMAPEQALGVSDVDHRADLYALGMTLFRLVTGQFAFDAEASTAILMKRLTEPCPDPRVVEPSISEGCQKIILRLAQKEKEDRYQHAVDLIRDLDLALAGKPIAAVAATAPKPVAPRPAPVAAQQGITVALPIPSEPPWIRELVPANIPGAAPPVESPPDPVAAAIVHQARTGDGAKVREAAGRIVAALPRLAQDPKACAKAEAQLARLALVLGDRANAEKWSRAALDHDPCSLDGFDVLSRAGRGEGSRHQLEVLLAAAREAVAQGNFDHARRWAEKAHEAFFHDPQPHLVTAVACKLAGDEPGFVDALRAAWGAYPAKERQDAGLGGLDGLACDLLVAHGRSAFKETGLVKATVDGIDDKQNLIAGALRLAIGVARVALERGGLSAFGERRLHFAACRALSGLRRYDEALLALGRAAALGPTEVERQAHEAERAFIAAARVVPVPVPTGKYRCPGTSALVEQTAAFGRNAARDKTGKVAEVEKLGPEVAALAQADPDVRAELRQAAERLGLKDPFAHLEPIEQELAGLDKEKTRPAEKKEEKKASGFFGMLKDAAGAAAAVAAGAARDAQLKLKRAQLEGNHEQAARVLGVNLSKELREGQYRHPKLAPIMKKAAAWGVAIEWCAKEETRCSKDVERLSAL